MYVRTLSFSFKLYSAHFKLKKMITGIILTITVLLLYSLFQTFAFSVTLGSLSVVVKADVTKEDTESGETVLLVGQKLEKFKDKPY